MKKELRQIYDDLSKGKLSQEDALGRIKAIKLQGQGKRIGALLVTPVWQASGVEGSAEASKVEYTEHHVILCELSKVNVGELGSLVAHSQCLSLQAGEQKNIAQRYSEYAVACLERIQGILQGKPAGQVLVQIVVADYEEQVLFAGLTGLLKTAALENPQLTGQLILVTPEITAEELAKQLQAEKSGGRRDALIKYEPGGRQVLGWQEVGGEGEKPPMALRDDGVYLITGGLGGLGFVFAKEILEQTGQGRVVLTGRSALSAEIRGRLEGLSGQAGRVSYRQLDLGNLEQVEQLMAGIREEYHQLNGIVHSAGQIADNFILKKGRTEFSEVLEPKVSGTYNLDQASREVELDFLVLFSSIAGAMGNLGQGDYATANGFMDQFAWYRNRQVEAKQRQGRTRSINWGLWQAGGMGIDAASQELLQEATGMRPMRTATGVEAFYRSLALPYGQMLVVEGELAKLRRALLGGAAVTTEAHEKPAVVVAESERESLAEKTQEYLRKQFSSLLKLPAHKIDPQAALEQYGIDSILAMKLTNQLEQTFGSLSKTLFFEYQTIRELTEYFVAHYSTQLTALFATTANRIREAVPLAAQVLIPAQAISGRHYSRLRSVTPGPATGTDSIAIIGLSGRYPEAVNLDAYWQNLRQGKDCIVEVPKERWDWRAYFSEDRSQSGHHYSKWGGFIAGVDEFDPLFFNISPLEAELIDPQERLFLQHAWMAIEDAGYTRAGLQVAEEQDLAGQVGVYVGLMYSEYQLFGAEASVQGKRLGIAGSAASIANRVSYTLNLHGPSMTLDSMCSSSLTAIHIACQDLKQGRTSLAIAGGVNVSIHPNKYLVLSAGQFISSEGHCQSFGEGGDGYIPGEGVGVVVLKRLSEAKRDGDHIYGIIRGSALTHGGKTNGYTVPNPQAQSSAISRALAESKTDARHISYIEAHGTGTKLGDPIEIAGLSKAFQQYTQEREFCRIGSAKSNIGHCESAAGIAGLTKVLLQMQHGEIVPSLHSGQLNAHIDFGKSPFVVNQELRVWERPVIEGRKLPRMAGVSSFGAGGSNGHLIVEEYERVGQAGMAMAKVVIVLSARTGEQLRQKARDLLSFLRGEQSAVASGESLDLVGLAYTLQVGREGMEERVGMEVSSVEQLGEKLAAYVAGEQGIEELYEGQVKGNKEALSLFRSDVDLQQAVEKWIAQKKLSKLLEMWVKGLEVDWSRLYGEGKPQRMSLPVYPFAKERYWIETGAGGEAGAGKWGAAGSVVLHPLLQRNTSDLSEQRYSTTFTGEEFFLRDHRVRREDGREEKILPGVAYLEMARAAIEQAMPGRGEGRSLELQHVVWAQAMVVVGKREVSIALWAKQEGEIDYEIYSGEGEQEIVHCQGGAVWSGEAVPGRLDLEQLKEEMGRGKLDANSVYAARAGMGVEHGPALQAIRALHRGSGQVLAELRLPKGVEEKWGEYVLHPSLMDGALQACVGLMEGGGEGQQQQRLPFALERLSIVAGCSKEMYAWVRYGAGSGAGDKVVKLDIDVCDAGGNVCVQMRGFSSRVLSPEIRARGAADRAMGSVLAIPVWQASGVEGSAKASKVEYAEHHVILCELSKVNVGELGSLVAHSQCLSLQAGEQKNIAQRYSEYAVACLERIQGILQGKPAGQVLVQIVVADYEEQVLFAGLTGLLKTAALENPQLTGQLILVTPEITAEELAKQLQAEKSGGRRDALIKYEPGGRQVLGWQEVGGEGEKPPMALRDDGVYLITGGLGGLGFVFAKEILEQTGQGRVVLTGRSALSAEIRGRLEGLSGQAGRVSYRQLDLGNLEQVEQLMAGIREEYHQLNGIVHSAGQIADNFILKKGRTEFSEVLEPKVSGTYNLDQASREVELDFLVLFSSIAGAMGNLGQGDYATANGFMDQFAWYRNRQVEAKQRQGRTRSINWGLWQAGGMGIDAASQELLQEATGMRPMRTATGVEAFYRSLALPYGQMLVVEGELAKLRRALLGGAAVTTEAHEKPAVVVAESERESLAEKTQEYLRKQFSSLLKLPAHKIDPQAALEQYGIDSILAMKLTNQLEQTFGSLSKTLFFEYQTIAGLARYFVKAHPAIVREKIGLLDEQLNAKGADQITIGKRGPTPARRSKNRFLASKPIYQKDIAVIGLGGKYPKAENLQEFWRNLQNGRDCITEIPSDRWDYKLYYDPDQNKLGKSYSKWGGFIADVDKFDPLFFNISPREAALIDPQERLFLETAWQTIEDAGYSKENISGKRVGVFVGVMWGQYELFGAESILRGNTTVSSSSHASIANRVSYFFDFHGPSIALDTMCSSSLTAIHLACEELRKGELDAAIAGGVNLTIHPYKYVSLSQGKFVASDGKCRSFGEGGDGYVPGEGVGAVLLKPLENALRDGDQIYAVIKSSAVNHGGKTNGYTVPNPNAQADLILDALKKANIDPKTLSYVETHGTGTSLGDPIEISGLLKAFESFTEEKQFCPIGSVKSNIGHLESAAGIAAVTKALLQIKYQQLVPSLHADPLNPNINFEDSPFYVQTELTDWKRPATHPRRVGVSSFGAGGSNAHLILEEYADAREPEKASLATPPEAFILSARDPDALCRYAEKVVDFLENASGVSLANMAYTSQVARTPMDARLVIITSSLVDLRGKLNQWITLRKNEDINSRATTHELEDVFDGNIKEAQNSARSLIEGQAGKAFLQNLLANRDLEKIAKLWILGVEIDWSLMARETSPRRVTLPTYPFAKERCWITQETPSPRVVQKSMQDTRKIAAFGMPEEKRRTYYHPQWTLKPLATPEGERAEIGPILILDASPELFLTLKERLGNGSGDGPVILVKPGKSFQEIEPNIYLIDPEREDQFHELVESLKNKGSLPSVVLHHSSEGCDLEVKQEVVRQLDNGIYTLFYLCKALIKEKLQVPPRFVSVFSSHAGATAPLDAAIDGFVKTLALENPRYLAKVVDIQGGLKKNGHLSLSERADLIWDEICDNHWTTAREIRYRSHIGSDKQRLERFMGELVPYTLVEKKLSALPLRQNGVYLITGGLGGLGLIFGEYLAENFHSKLVLVGRSAPNAKQEEKLRQLRGYGAEILCLQADVSKLEDMQMVVREAKARFSEVNGVIHGAGVNRDAFILKKTKEEMEAVLAPKVYGTVNVDLATKSENLDLFVLFSSVAGVMGNVGQSDYAYANHFLNSFAESRENLTKAGKRSGRTLSINWPWWDEGGMRISRSDIALLEKQTGVCPLPTQEGIRYWEDFLRSDALQAVAVYGIPSKIAAYIAQKPAMTRNVSAPAEGVDPAMLFAKTEAYLKALIGEEVKLAPDRIGSSDRLESFGIDSVMINRLNTNLERDLGALPKTLLYEHETVGELAKFLLQEAREALIALIVSAGSAGEPGIPVEGEEEATQGAVSMPDENHNHEPIAIIGIHGHFPHSSDLAEYWENLKQGRDLIDLVPPNRWDFEEFYHPDPTTASEGKIYCKWGGFLDDHDKFDPHFFKISTDEAKIIDPQERLFLESVWAAIEDAGYTRDSLKKCIPKGRSADVGVFVGVTTNSYHLLSSEEGGRGNVVRPSALPWSIANRISYFFDFNGPSLPVDTACSSSLVAVHLACQSLTNRECQVAIAGGVNLYLHPSKYQSLCQRRMLSLDGKCHSYGAGDDGFVPGEGVGTLVLKPLSKALDHQDRIYAVIAASAFDHGGRSNGYSAPNPNSQASLISHALNKAHINPETIGYVEGHGTGTQLGDSIEIAALTQAFQKQTMKKQFCPIGSVKANMGHSESAAGIAGLAKVILQMEHRQLAPSIHSDEANPNIEFKESPFYLQHGLSEWESSPVHPRRALINSFGAGGVNACVILEEYEKTGSPHYGREAGPCLFTLSAKNEDRLREYVNRLLVRLKAEPAIDLASLCYTLQVGREAMEERLAIVVSEVNELIDRLSDWSKRRSSDNIYRGSLGPRRGSKRSSTLAKAAVEKHNLIELAPMWAAGEDVDWENLYTRNKPRRIALPTYPFARERYWVSDSLIPEKRTLPNNQLHPLISYNSSTLKEVSFSSSLSDTAFYAVDHKVNEEGIFPGAGFLEMACISGNIAGEQRVRKITDIVWMQPLSFRRGPQTVRTLLKHVGDSVEYVITSLDDENETILHSEGRLAFRNEWGDPADAEEHIPIQALKAQCASPEDGAAYYNEFRKCGINFGLSFQTIQEIYVNKSFALSRLKIADHLKVGFGQFILHPSMIDGALQTAAGLVRDLEPATLHLPFALDELDIVHPVRQTCYAYAELADSSEQNRAGVRKFNIRLLNESGDVLIKFKNLFFRALAQAQTSPRSPAAGLAIAGAA